MNSVTLEQLREALAEQRYETARRIGFRLLETTDEPEAVLATHDALARLGDLFGAASLLREHGQRVDPFTTALTLSRDFKRLAKSDHYRTSMEARQGFTQEEYLAKYLALAGEKLTEASALATSEEQMLILAEAQPAPAHASPMPWPDDGAIVTGKILLSDGTPINAASVVLGLQTRVAETKAEVTGPGFLPTVGSLEKRSALSDANGSFVISGLPEGTHDFLAAILDQSEPISTRFLARNITVNSRGTTDLGELRIADWQSAPRVEMLQPIFSDHGIKIHEFEINNPFSYDFPRQPLSIPLPENAVGGESTYRVMTSLWKGLFFPSIEEPCQLSGGNIVFLTSLPAHSRQWITVFRAPQIEETSHTSELVIHTSPDIWEIDTGAACLRLAGHAPSRPLAPLQAVKGADGVWRGRGNLDLPETAQVIGQSTMLLENGPVFAKIEVSLLLSNGQAYTLTSTAYAGEPYFLFHERSSELTGAACVFSLAEFSGGRGFLHWLPETGATHWTTLAREEREIARLPESIPWWIPPQGFAFAMTPDGLEQQDYIAVFSIRRGEWIDREFERLAQGPLDECGNENRELDWPYPEMVGSSISWITARTTVQGDACFRFGLFDGERHWGLLASTLAENDGPAKRLAAIQHANSSPRLQDFREWHLDEPDAVERPYLLAARSDILRLRTKRDHSRFRRIWDKIRHGRVPGAVRGLAFALDGDPLVAWKRRIELLAVARVRTRMTLLGRDRSDLYSPVGGRAITVDAEDYDLLAASGVFSDAEEREMRAYFILMGHMFMECDLMNWRFNSRNANFEADRVEVVGTIGLIFPGHPDGAKFLDHVIERCSDALRIYCTPGSGKWYENPGCYYLHASKCRMALLYHLARHGHLQLAEIPRLREFLRWGIILLTPPLPVSYAIQRDGDLASFLSADKIRKVPPIGDHSSLGRWLPEHYAFMGKLLMDSDPSWGRELLDAYFLSSGDGARLFHPPTGPVEQEGEQIFHGIGDGTPAGNLPLLFTALDEEDIPGAPSLSLTSRRLEGFGAVFREGFDTPGEVYILMKQGPGGYRFHRTEGSFLLFAGGRPLVYDGGEAGETWRHSTLSFFDAHMPLSAGRVERFFVSPHFQFSQGIHPEIIQPGEPVFLSDSCDHHLVQECYRRYKKPNPAVVRSFAWVGGRYLVIHDALNLEGAIPSHWHLQVVADEVRKEGVGNWQFRGRFGLDLQVLMPSQIFVEEEINPLPVFEYSGAPSEWFSMQHMRVSGLAVRNYLAILHPLTGHELSAEAIKDRNEITGIEVRGAGLHDTLWFARGGVTTANFKGQYGAVLRREDTVSLVLADAGCISYGSLRLESDGPCTNLTRAKGKSVLLAQGQGNIVAQINGKSFILAVTGSGTWPLE